jgi:hypothetical protein
MMMMMMMNVTHYESVYVGPADGVPGEEPPQNVNCIYRKQTSEDKGTIILRVVALPRRPQFRFNGS